MLIRERTTIVSKQNTKVPLAKAASPVAAGFRPAAGVIAIAAAFVASPEAAQAQPSGAQAIHGQASLSQQGTTLRVTTQNGAGTNHSAINWQSFSVPGGSTTHFQQPTAASLSINRVVGNDPSAIFGTLSSNGRLVLVNPAGIAVGAGAMVDTAGFTASTLRLSEANAIAGRLLFGGDGLASGSLTVEGTIRASGGDVVLIAPNVQVGSQAIVQSPNGATILAAGQKVELTGRGLEGIRLELQAPSDQALNLGTLQGDAVGIFAGQLKHSGLINATATSIEGGKVVLKAAGDALVDGRISAVSGSKGGSIDVLGQRVGLLAGAALDASGDQGGGSVRVGGDFQGKNASVSNAQRTYVARSATISADARISGDGGRVIVWADDQTQSYGAISARGGAQGGDGGFVEVSGKHRLAFDSFVDTRAPMGKVGTLLLDPDNITVSAAPSPAVLTDADAFSDTGDVTISAATISNATSNVLLQATNQIDFSAEISMVTEGVGLTAQAGGSINVGAPITTKGGAVVLSAGDPGTALGPSNGRLYVSSDIDTTGGGVFAGASVTLSSAISEAVGANSVYVQSSTINTGGADLAMSGLGGVFINGSSISTSGGDININGGKSTLSGAAGAYISGSTIDADTGAVIISGESADWEGFVLDAGGATVSGSSVAITGKTGVGSGKDALKVSYDIISATSDIRLTAVNGLLALNSATITNSGSGGITLEAKTTAPAPIPGIYIDSSSTVENIGASPGEIHLVGDFLNLLGQIDSGFGRTVIKTATASRGIELGSTNDVSKLALSQFELTRVNAGVIVIGDSTSTGGLSVQSSIGVGSGSLSLIQNSAASITQAGGATIYANALNADAGSVVLTEANTVSMISGRATNASGTGFVFSNNGGSDLTVGIVDGVIGIDSGTGPTSRNTVTLNAVNGSIWGFEAIRGSSLTASAGVNVMLTSPGNDLTFIDAMAVAGDAVISNNAPAARLNASAGGTVAYRGFGALKVDTIVAGGSVALEADSIAAQAGKGNIHAFNDGHVFLRAANGAIGDSANALRIATSGGVFAQALGAGGNVYLSTPSTAFKLHLETAGLASITGPGAGATLGLFSANVGGALSWRGFDSAMLGTSDTSTTAGSGSGGMLRVALAGGTSVGSDSGGATFGKVSAGGPITAEGDVYLAGILAPGGTGGIATMAVSGNLHILDGAAMEFDFDGTSHDQINVTGNVVFPSTAGTSTVLANAKSQPPGGSYKLITGATSGELPSVTGNVVGASLAFGSLVMNVGSPPAPVSGSTVDQIAALINGDYALAAQVVAELDTNPLTTFTTLLQQEEEKQDADGKGLDNVVDDNQCRR
jgi:filamentous hemagglutinin family protein